MLHIKELISKMEKRGIASAEDITGVSDHEILALERHFGLILPSCYIQFLRNFGRSAGYLSPWMRIYIEDIKTLRTEFKLLLATLNKEHLLPDNALFIGNWESIFDYILCDGSSDPIVFRIDLCSTESAIEPSQSKSYSTYLENMIDNADTASIPMDFFKESRVFAKMDSVN